MAVAGRQCADYDQPVLRVGDGLDRGLAELRGENRAPGSRRFQPLPIEIRVGYNRVQPGALNVRMPGDIENAMTDALESALVKRAASGDPVAVTLLLTHSYARLHAQLEKRIPADLRSTLGVEDIIQEAQIQVFRNIQTFEVRGSDSFYRWFATMALHHLRNDIKAQRTLKRSGGQRMVGSTVLDGSIVALLDLMSGPEKTPSHHAARREALDAVAEGLALLPEQYRQAVRLVYIEGRPVADAAELMGRTPRAIHNLCHKAKKMLRDILGSSSRYLSRS